MPGINGHQVLSSFKKDPNFHSPIIVLTGLADPKHKESSLAEGADAFMTKPPNRELLLAKVTELLNPRP
jgi:CheY-like chemotaxis protein